ncbi:dNA mismatch repair protein MutS [Clostridium sp. CAG:167]|nr:dNA mismatch repair protein MutS [Clostridium sp. CAG:167]
MEIQTEKLTPMMQQYMETKNQYKDCILFYRLGDFYEMFFDDALCVTKELELTLTGKSCGLDERAPMCGVPFHSAESYINRLVERGYKVAICEQVEDPKSAKGLVKREVIRVVTPGTNSFTSSLDETRNNYLMGIVSIEGKFGISVVDVTTGEYLMTEVDSVSKLLDEINKFTPSEIICNDTFYISGVDMNDLSSRLGIVISPLDPSYFDKDSCQRALCRHFKVSTLEGLGFKEYAIGTIAAGSIMQYLEETQKCSLAHISHLLPYHTGKYMLLDRNTRRNLELVETLREKQKRGSLLWVLDKTKTAMGARKLRSSLEQPLIDKETILRRYDAIDELNQDVITREELREYLNPVYDLERLLSKISYKTVNPRDMIALESSLSMLPHIRLLCSNFKSDLFQDFTQNLDPLEDVYQLIHSAIVEEPPISVREGGIFKNGFNEEIDHLRNAKTEGKNWLADLETTEKEQTGIKNLRIKYNKVFGYYLEVTKSFVNQVPDTWIRKQTLTNAERYTTPELKEMEDTILGAEDRLYNLEYAVFCQLREEIFQQMDRIQQTASVIASIDMIASLAYVAEHNHYVRPKLNNKGILRIKDGRHPVIEQMIAHDMFIPNDTFLDEDSHRLVIITGPNMAGKSTYMRQTALIVLMAQLGSFVPASQADISLVDRIFTRVGASDDLASGQSTFMVEMTEVANILHNATKNSLIILDEIGRGTSTFDGLSIAWSVVEHIVDKKLIGAKTLFATHYHELTELEGKLEGVQNYCIAVKEDGEDIVFLHKIVKGGADKSYGIQVAKLAGVPEQVLIRAREIADQLENKDALSLDGVVNQMAVSSPGEKTMNQLSIFDTMGNDQTDDILFELRDIDLSRVTPMDAMNLVYKWQKSLQERW